MIIINKKRPPSPSVVLDTYWKFAAERQEVFFKKLNKTEPLTIDPILLKYKFTNAYRACDRVSQYLIGKVIDNNETDIDETLFKILVFKIFNKIETWELLESELGYISFKYYSFDAYNRILTSAIKANEPIYSAAYIMASGKSAFGYDRKHENHLKLIEQMVGSKLAHRIQDATSLEDVYHYLLLFPSIGPFLAYQYSIDINYSQLVNFSENDYVVPGPGAKDGIKKCFTNYGDYSEPDIIKYVTDNQEAEFQRLGINFKSLWGRPLHLIDCQNLFCETAKYARVAHPDIDGISDRKRIKQIYSKNNSDIYYYFPPKWNLNTNP